MSVSQQLQLPPSVLKIVLARQLVQLRDRHGSTQDEVATRLRIPQQKVARFESGSGIKPHELDELLDFYNADEADRAYTRSLQTASWHRTKRGAFSTRFRQYLRLFIDMEQSALRNYCYRALLVPGLLQTEEYMRRNARAWRPSMTAAQIDESTSNRLDRQRVLDNAHQQFWFVVDEAALRRIETDSARTAQIARLIEAMDRPNVELQIVPFEVGYYMGQGHDYTIFGFDTQPTVDIIYLEKPDGGEYVQDREQAVRYLTLRDYQKAAAHGPEQTRKVLLDMAKPT